MPIRSSELNPESNSPPPTDPHRWELVESRYLAEYRLIRLREDRYRSPDHAGDQVFIACESVEWVTVIPVTEDDQVVFVRQYRHGVRKRVLEIPGGVIERDESPVAAAARELREETGYVADGMVYLGRFMPNPALIDGYFHVVAARGCRPVGPVELDPTEELTVELIPLGDVPQLIRQGRLTHALVIAAFACSGMLRFEAC